VESRKGACVERELLFLSNYGFARVRSIHLSHALRTGARPKAVGSIPNAILYNVLHAVVWLQTPAVLGAWIVDSSKTRSEKTGRLKASVRLLGKLSATR
jgi:hypothetical protein